MSLNGVQLRAGKETKEREKKEKKKRVKMLEIYLCMARRVSRFQARLPRQSEIMFCNETLRTFVWDEWHITNNESYTIIGDIMRYIEESLTQ